MQDPKTAQYAFLSTAPYFAYFNSSQVHSYMVKVCTKRYRLKLQTVKPATEYTIVILSFEIG